MSEWVSEWVSERMSVQCQISILFYQYPHEKKMHFNEIMLMLNFYLDLFFSASTQTLPSAGWNVAHFGHINLTRSLPHFDLTP
jgi:hypothetical protein